MELKREETIYVLVSLVLTLALVVVLSEVFVREFNTGQESLDYYYFLRLVVSNDVNFSHPLVSHQVGLETITPYNHWTNGQYALTWLVLKLAGADTLEKQERVTRTLSVLLFLVSAFVIIFSVARSQPFLYLSIPFVFATNMGREAIPFIWTNLPLVAISLFLITNAHHNKFFKYAFWAEILLLPLINQTVLLFIFFFILVDFFIHRDWKFAIRNILCFLVSAGIVGLILITAFGPDIAIGWKNLLDITGDRTVIGVLRERPHHFLLFLKFLIQRLIDFNLGIPGALLVVLSWVIALRQKEWWLAALLPSWLLFALILAGATFQADYAYLSYVFFAAATLFYGMSFIWKEYIAQLFQQILPRLSLLMKRESFHWILQVGFVVVLMYNAYIVPTSFPIVDFARENWLGVRDVYSYESSWTGKWVGETAGFLHELDSPRVREQLVSFRCNSFNWKEPKTSERVFAATAELVSELAPAVLGRYVTQRVELGIPIRSCAIGIDENKNIFVDAVKSISNNN